VIFILFDAYRDLKYLLNRGYRKSIALNFVANHYKLRLKERHLLARCVFSDEDIETRMKKIKPMCFIEGKTLAVDGFNVLITLESVLEGKAVLCEDNIVRDLKYQGGYKQRKNTAKTLELLISFISKFSPKEVVFFYDAPISGSGKIAKLTEEILRKFNLLGEAKTVKGVDKELKRFEVVATSDIGVIDKVPYIIDLPFEIAKNRSIKIKKLEEILQS
jgi:hypothetical protein